MNPLVTPKAFAVKDDNGNISYQYEQPGEIITESSIEYRTKIVGFIHGAAFLDVGNVWMLTDDPAREGAKFKLNSFYKQFAVCKITHFNFCTAVQNSSQYCYESL